MTSEEQRIVILEWLGWTFHRTFGPLHSVWVSPDKKHETMMPNLPDYPHDLNACMEFCRRLAAEGWFCVCNMGKDGTWEAFFTTRPQGITLPGIGDAYGAADTLSAALCEAVLRVIGKWKETE